MTSNKKKLSLVVTLGTSLASHSLLPVPHHSSLNTALFISQRHHQIDSCESPESLENEEVEIELSKLYLGKNLAIAISAVILLLWIDLKQP